MLENLENWYTEAQQKAFAAGYAANGLKAGDHVQLVAHPDNEFDYAVLDSTAFEREAPRLAWEKAELHIPTARGIILQVLEPYLLKVLFKRAFYSGAADFAAETIMQETPITALVHIKRENDPHPREFYAIPAEPPTNDPTRYPHTLFED